MDSFSLSQSEHLAIFCKKFLISGVWVLTWSILGNGSKDSSVRGSEDQHIFSLFLCSQAGFDKTRINAMQLRYNELVQSKLVIWHPLIRSTEFSALNHSLANDVFQSIRKGTLLIQDAAHFDDTKIVRTRKFFDPLRSPPKVAAAPPC